MASLLIKHHWTRVEIVTPDQEECEHELEIVGDDASIETQGRHLSILFSHILIHEVYIRVLVVHELLYLSLFA